MSRVSRCRQPAERFHFRLALVVEFFYGKVENVNDRRAESLLVRLVVTEGSDGEVVAAESERRSSPDTPWRENRSRITFPESWQLPQAMLHDGPAGYA